MKSSYITWLPQCRKSDALAAALGGKSHLIHWLGFKRPWLVPVKYPLQAVETLVHLYNDKPDLILVATPPVVATIPVYFYARIRNIPFVVEAHTGVFDDPRWTWLLPLSRWMSRAATATLVTNEYLERVVKSWDARPVVIDVVPMTIPDTQLPVSRDDSSVVLINTFSRDEPVEAVVKAAKNTPDISLYITGNLKRAPRGLQEAAPPNVHFTGWLSDDEYGSLLQQATVVMVLTTRDHTMQRGANEAMMLGKPLITSDWHLLREIFNRGTIHVDNTVASITAAIEVAVRNHKSLALEMKSLRLERNREFEVRLNNLLAIVKKHSHFSVNSDNKKEPAHV